MSDLTHKEHCSKVMYDKGYRCDCGVEMLALDMLSYFGRL